MQCTQNLEGSKSPRRQKVSDCDCVRPGTLRPSTPAMLATWAAAVRATSGTTTTGGFPTLEAATATSEHLSVCPVLSHDFVLIVKKTDNLN